MLGGILPPISTLSQANIINVWRTQENVITARHQYNTVYFSVQTKEMTTAAIPISQVVGIPTVPFDILTWRAFWANTSVQLVQLESTYKLYITPRLCGGGHVINDKRNIWPTPTIAYEIDVDTFDISSHERAMILAAIQIWNKADTGFTFVPRSNEQDFLFFGKNISQTDHCTDSTQKHAEIPTELCTTPIGYQTGKQYVYCTNNVQDNDPSTTKNSTLLFKRNVMHQIGHALGLLDEHTRADRDNFLDNGTTAIQCKEHARCEDRSSIVGRYDFASIMHKPVNIACSVGCYLSPTSTFPEDGEAQIGYLDILSPGDIEAVKHLRQLANSYQEKSTDESCQTFVIHDMPPILTANEEFVEQPQWQRLRKKGEEYERKEKWKKAVSHYETLLSEYQVLIKGAWQAHPLMMKMVGQCQYLCGWYYGQEENYHKAKNYYNKATHSLAMALLDEKNYDRSGAKYINEYIQINASVNGLLIHMQALMLEIEKKSR